MPTKIIQWVIQCASLAVVAIKPESPIASSAIVLVLTIGASQVLDKRRTDAEKSLYDTAERAMKTAQEAKEASSASISGLTAVRAGLTAYRTGTGFNG